MINPLIRLGLSVAIILSSAATLAAELTVGQPAPTMRTPVQSLTIDSDNIHYQDWQSSDLTGKVRAIQHLNAALGVDAINKDFIDTLNELNLDASVFTTLTVLNVSDVASFLQTMGKMQIEDMRRTNTEGEYVWDTQASVRSAWGLPEKGASITLVDATGKVIAHKDGKLEPEEMKKFVALIQQHLPE